MNICIIGVGLIGGSIAIDLKVKGFASHIIGVDTNPDNRSIAYESGLVDEFLDLDEAIKKTELIIIATPVDSIISLLPGILDKVTGQVVTDMGSTKECIINSVRNHPNRSNYVPGHPMAGTEYSGPGAAIPKLFNKKVAIICDMKDSGHHALELVTQLYMALNMRLVFMSAREHDLHAAYVSHISHITSFALALTVLEKEKDEKTIFNLAGGGFDSTVRLAASSSEMWTPVFSQNKPNVLEVIKTYIDKMQDFMKAIENNQTETISKLITEANKIQNTLNLYSWKQN